MQAISRQLWSEAAWSETTWSETMWSKTAAELVPRWHRAAVTGKQNGGTAKRENSKTATR
jgi:hypothetical protein